MKNTGKKVRNPAGRAGDPISFGNLSFNEVLGDLGKIKVPPKPEKKPKAKPTTGG
ncbi:MAG: hypothetical protein WCC04_10325 [Terriglobales bacterium]